MYLQARARTRARACAQAYAHISVVGNPTAQAVDRRIIPGTPPATPRPPPPPLPSRLPSSSHSPPPPPPPPLPLSSSDLSSHPFWPCIAEQPCRSGRMPALTVEGEDQLSRDLATTTSASSKPNNANKSPATALVAPAAWNTAFQHLPIERAVVTPIHT